MAGRRMNDKKTKWFRALESLRGLCFIAIYVSHSHQFINYYGDLGGVGVEFFFILSGFLSAYFFAPKNSGSILKDCVYNLWKKIKSFWPLHVLFVFVAVRHSGVV